MKIALIVAASTGLLAAASGARADLITDGGFETVASLASGGYQVETSGSGTTTGPIGGWVWSTGVTSDQYNGATLIQVGSGSNSPWITPGTQTGFGGGYVAGLQGLGGVSQSFTDTQGSGVFDLSYAIAGRGHETSAGYQTVDVELLDTTSSSAVFLGAVSTTGGSAFTTYNDLVSLNSGDTYTVSFIGTTSDGADETALLDNVSLTHTVAEPSSLAVLGASLCGLAFLRRRAQA